MTVHDELTGDYGYDCASEVRTALRLPLPRRATSPITGTGRELDPDGGDLGYDMAHDF
jgi:hypothetical protein